MNKLELRFRLAKMWVGFYRFRDLKLARHVFRDIKGPCFVRRTVYGGQLHIDVARSEAQQLIYLNGDRFLEEQILVEQLVKPGMRTIDVGANIGYYLLLLRKLVGNNGFVTCIEPSPENLIELHETIRLNAFDNVELFEVALGEKAGSVAIRAGINSGVVEGDGAFEVPLRRLDETVHGPVEFIKIDVDGYEGQVLTGATGLLRDRPNLLVEMHPHLIPRFGYSVAGIRELLAQYYDTIEMYRPVRPQRATLISKIKSRYFHGARVVLEANEADHLADCAAGKAGETFWYVCRG